MRNVALVVMSVMLFLQTAYCIWLRDVDKANNDFVAGLGATVNALYIENSKLSSHQDVTQKQNFLQAVSQTLSRQEKILWQDFQSAESTIKKSNCTTKAQLESFESLRSEWCNTHSALSSVNRLLGQD